MSIELSIEQTNQLILLILNSVLMMLLSAALLGGAWLRQNMLAQQLHRLHLSYRAIAHKRFDLSDINSGIHGDVHPSDAIQNGDAVKNGDAIKNAVRQSSENYGSLVSSQSFQQTQARLKRIRSDRQRLRNQYWWSHIGMLTLHMVLLIFSVSLFTLVMRSFLSFDGLISTSLFMFALGSAGVLAGIGCVLIDLAQGDSGGDSLGHSLGKAIAQIGRHWQTRTARFPRVSSRRKAAVPVLIPSQFNQRTRSAFSGVVSTEGRSAEGRSAEGRPATAHPTVAANPAQYRRDRV